MKARAGSRANFFLSLLTAVIVVLLDRATKIFFTQKLSFGESIPVIHNVFHFSLVHNTGIAFGLFRDQGVVFILIPVIAIVVITFHIYNHRLSKDVNRWYLFAFSLILGGAIGNLIDRVVFGYVIDFIDFRIWPVFNIADSAITIGTTIILIQCIPSFAKSAH